MSKTKTRLEIEAPDGLSTREFAAYRLGALTVLLASVEEFSIEMPGIFRQSFENEIAFREQQLQEPVTHAGRPPHLHHDNTPASA